MSGWAALWLGVVAVLAITALIAANALIAWLHVEARWMAVVLAALVLVPVVVWASSHLVSRWSRVATALRDGLASLKDRDFSVSVTRATHDELGELVAAYNDLGDKLRVERQSLYQRELMLDTVIQTTPLALVLTNNNDAVIYSNSAARHLFSAGRKLEGHKFEGYLSAAPAPLRDAIARGGDTLFTLELAGEPQVFHVSQRSFLLNTLPHRLLLLKQLTREINSQEVATWKKVIRVIAHELNNSLAPISSLAHSGQILARAPPDPDQLARVFATIEDRARHLGTFIEGYAQFAKLPKPRLAPVTWAVLIERLRAVVKFRFDGTVPTRPAVFDSAQIEQALINLLKNAAESGSPEEAVELVITPSAGGCTLEIRDRGPGFTSAALENALVPFFSTKATGTGLGLTLCREIVEAHGGRLRIGNREGGGAIVTLWLPDA
jgi:two-component system, NtrC family, nitrogen regulation sensor histidine kinase NtrY